MNNEIRSPNGLISSPEGCIIILLFHIYAFVLTLDFDNLVDVSILRCPEPKKEVFTKMYVRFVCLYGPQPYNLGSGQDKVIRLYTVITNFAFNLRLTISILERNRIRVSPLNPFSLEVPLVTDESKAGTPFGFLFIREPEERMIPVGAAGAGIPWGWTTKHLVYKPGPVVHCL